MHHIIHDLQKYFLVGMLLFLLILVFWFAASFLGTLFLAAIIATTIYPIKEKLNRAFNSPALSTLVTLIIAVVVIYGILTWFSVSVAGQATDAYSAINVKLSQWAQNDYSLLPAMQKFPRLSEWLGHIKAYNPVSMNDVVSAAGGLVGGISSFILGQTTNVLKQLSVFLLHTIIFILALFYFLRDGEQIVLHLKSLLPLSEKYRKELFCKMNKLIHAIMYGIFGAAILQGVLVGVGLAIVGVSSAAFWGALAALLSPIPYLGTSVIWVPVVIYLFVTGHFGMGLFLLIWGILIVGMADNILKPYLIGTTTSLHPLAVMTVLLGGAFAFGFKGLIFGPFVLMLTIAFLHIYKLEYKVVLDGLEHEEPKKPQKKFWEKAIAKFQQLS